MKEGLMICDRCRKSAPVSDMKYIPKGDSKITLCSSCRSKNDVSKKTIKKEQSQKIPYFCSRCRYKFKFSHDGITNLKCPYCGRSDKITEDEASTADTLIKLS